MDEIIKYKTEEKKSEIIQLKNELSRNLEEIIHNEKKLTSEYSQTIISKLKIKQTELEAHKKIKPSEVIKPETGISFDLNDQALLKQLEAMNIEESNLKNLIDKDKINLDLLHKKKAFGEKVIQKIDLIEKQFNQEYSLIEPALIRMKIIPNDILLLKINKDPIVEIIKNCDKEIEAINFNLDFKKSESLIYKLNEVQDRIKKIINDIDEPNRKYRTYVKDLELWNKNLENIQGDSTKPDTIGYFTAQLGEIDSIPTKLNKLESERDILVQKIFSLLTELVKVYEQFYAPVQNFINNNPLGDDTFKMSFNVSIIDMGFSEHFFNQINRHRAGTYYGKEGSEKYLEKVLFKYDFNQVGDVVNFTREIINSLKYDLRDDKKIPNNISAQVKDNKLFELYKFVFGLDYLEPRYSIKLNGKNLELLSPGERGTLLLIFYLMIDKDDRPLVIDQPEENLDNQTIYKVLVPCIKTAKKFRQLFLVTHNPNLAIVCDAEQVIVTSINKAAGNKVDYFSGAIENGEINEFIINILEGTRPAFDNRKSKYFSVQNFRNQIAL
ncbi:MAG: hypothetical protein JSR33_10630 [Proteobacteria bacterium]|nr:hypothetical protein [Pseudomonadota bacterium]